MNLAVDVTSLSESWAGMQYYTSNFVESLLRVSEETISLVRGRSGPNLSGQPSVRTVEVPRLFNSRVLREQITLPLTLAWGNCRPDRLLVPAYLGPIVSNCPLDMIVYDFLYLREDSGHSLKDNLYWKGLYRLAFYRAGRLYPISRTTRDAIVKQMPWAEEKIGPVLYPGQRSYERAERTSESLDPFLLFVGTVSPRKNVSALLKFYRSAPDAITDKYDLRIAGKHGWGQPQPKDLHRPDEGIHWEGRVSDQRLLTLYEQADLLVLPSKGEGFGMPVIEAFRRRLPVVLSPLEVFREVAGKAAWYLPSTEYSPAWNDVIKDALENPGERRTKTTRGYRRSRRFRWANAAKTYLRDIRNRT